MQLSEFKGINKYHDGNVVSDYCNMIPMNDSVIDRLGEELIVTLNDGNAKVLNTFIDSKNNIYVATTHGVRIVDSAGNPKSWEGGADFVSQNGLVFNPPGIADFRRVTFCESSTKPAQVYMCDGLRVYAWNLESLVTDTTAIQTIISNYGTEMYRRTVSYAPTLLPFGDFNPADIAVNPAAKYQFWPSLGTGNDSTFRANYGHTAKLWNISSIAWYDNRLVMAQTDKNTVWLTEVDPSRWIVPVQAGNWQPFNIIQNIGNNPVTVLAGQYWYSSTADAASLQDIVAFAGQLYFLNTFSIEVWTATGNKDNPIQSNYNNIIHYGGRSPCIIADTLYLICKDQIRNDFIAAIHQGGQFTKVSTPEIERLIQPGADQLRPLAVRDQSMVVVYRNVNTDSAYLEGFVFTPSGYWWRYYNSYAWEAEHAVWTIGTINGRVFEVTNYGNICCQTDSHRRHAGGYAIKRSLRGAFAQFIGRKILRSVEIICDTGVCYAKVPGKLYLRNSFDRGLTFGPYLYRALGLPGTNDRQIIWRNVGSGNSMLLEIGTADEVRFQIYGINIELS